MKNKKLLILIPALMLTFGGLSTLVSCGPTEQDVKVTSVTLNKTELSLEVGASETLTATIAPDNATNKGLTWTVAPEGYATVSALGKVTAGQNPGECVVTATAKDGSGKYASCAVTVVDTASAYATDFPVVSFADAKAATPASGNSEKMMVVGKLGAITQATYGNSTLTQPGSEETLTVYGMYDVYGKRYDAEDIAVKPVENNIVVLEGQFTFYNGTKWEILNAVIRQCDGTVYNYPELTEFALGPANATVEEGKSLTLTVTPNAGAQVALTDFTWVSSAPAVATVTDGVVTGVAASADPVTITATHKTKTNLSATLDVTVEAAVDINYGTEDEPLTVAEALAIAELKLAAQDSYTEEMLWVRAVVTNAPTVNSNYGWKNFNLADASDLSKTLLAYSANKSDSCAKLAQNDTVTIHGALKNYQGTIEFTNVKVNNVTIHDYPALSNRVAGTSSITVQVEHATVSEIAASATNDTQISFTVTPDANYVVSDVKVYGASLTPTNNTYSFTLAGNATIVVTTASDSAPVAVSLLNVTAAADVSARTNSYTGSFTATVDNKTVAFSAINNGSTDSPWTDAWRFGRKSADSTATIITGQAFTGTVSQVEFVCTQFLSTGLTSAKAYVSTDGENWTEAADFTSDMAVDTISIDLGDKAAANLYVKLEFVMTSTGSNGSIRFSGVNYKGFAA